MNSENLTASNCNTQNKSIIKITKENTHRKGDRALENILHL